MNKIKSDIGMIELLTGHRQVPLRRKYNALNMMVQDLSGGGVVNDVWDWGLEKGKQGAYAAGTGAYKAGAWGLEKVRESASWGKDMAVKQACSICSKHAIISREDMQDIYNTLLQIYRTITAKMRWVKNIKDSIGKEKKKKTTKGSKKTTKGSKKTNKGSRKESSNKAEVPT